MKRKDLFCLPLAMLFFVAGLASEPKKVNELNKSLLQATADGNIDEVKSLLSQGADVNVRDTFGQTALHHAIVKGHEKIVELLINRGSNIDAKDNAGRTPLHYAAGAGGLYGVRDWAQAGDPNIVRILFDKGANINAADKEGRTPLHYATINSILRRDMAMVRLFVEHGADLNIVDRRGRTPYAIIQWVLYVIRGSAEFPATYGRVVKDIKDFLSKNGCNYVVASDGNDLNPGTVERPFKTVECALRIAEADDTILVRGGIYHCASTVHLDKSGGRGKPIRLRAYSNEAPVFDFSRAKGSGFVITGAYWHLKGLTIANAENTGIDLETPGAHHNVLEQICVQYNSDAGLVLRIGVTQNIVLNCDSYRNFDPWTNGENADGFGVSYNVGDGNLFVGCRAWNNSDDGFDFDRAGASLRLENCYVWRNGMNIWNHPCFTGNGSGFKLWDSGHILIRCAAWDHHGHGFNRSLTTHTAFLKNCTAIRDNINYSFRGASGTERDMLINNLSCGAVKYIHPDVNDQFNSWNAPPEVDITKEDFLSLDDSVITGPRNSDGSIPKSDFLRLAPGSDAIDAGTDVGLPFAGKAPDLGAFEYDPDKVKRQSGVKRLHQAVRDHDIAKIKSMLSEKADVNEKDWLGYAPLHWAVYFGYADVSDLLISQGADPNLLSDTGRTPLEIAEAMEYDELAELLRKNGAKK
jgi:ankyrin repeat protein